MATEQSTAPTAAPTPATASRVPHRWRNLLTLTGVTAVDNTETNATSTLFPSISTALGLTSGNLGTLAALGKIASVPTGPFWVWLAGRMGRRATLVLTTVLGGLFGILAGFAQNFGFLLLCNTLMAACLIGASPISNAVIADSFTDRERGKAAGVLYGVTATFGQAIGPVIALFTGFSDGWRYGMWAIGGVCVVAGLIVAVGFKDPGVGAAEEQLADLSETARVKKTVTVKSVLSLFRIPTYSVMMISRLLSGHLLLVIFGIQFLVSERGFSNATAAVVGIPMGVGYLAGTVGGGYLLAFVDRRWPTRGRVSYLQLAQVLFAVAAFFGTQFHYSAGIGIYCVFWALMGFGQGMNPPANRPLVSAVVLPELRGQAFAIWLSIFETIAWALFALAAGQLAESLGLQQVFLWVMVVLMLLNAAVLGVLHSTYPRDARRVTHALEERRRLAHGGA
ncbi:major facilitator family transporter [Streptomyces himastatinicus ATCC 53653]|uniref:Major facilitator family transporter n=1 Tax=Streptomyces himastatinicus ATCC 53653 TaxID=457427 RepID=D9WKP5_9ACTN|nr:MFS transporter [Streptomyces himastatinicus]EFL27735.1 major facilitator family transporter [Streptomyces himastatinicus ATCC 53653]